MRAAPGQGGYTVIEVMVITLIVGLVLAASLPAFRNLIQSNDLHSGSEEFAARLRLARQSAVAEGVPYIVQWNSGNATYTIGHDDNGNGQLDAGEITLGPVSLPSTLSLSNSGGNPFSSDQVTFTPDGQASETGTVVLQNVRGASVNLSVLAPTGLVRIG